MKLETSDLAGYIKERHRAQVRALRQKPVLVIVVVGDEAASASFIRAKQRYGQDIGIDVQVVRPQAEEELHEQLVDLSGDSSVTGIVLQLPLPTGFDTDATIELINPDKDIDGLGQTRRFEPATAKAIMWILASLSLNIKEAQVCVVGQGRLVGAPISSILESSGAKVVRCDVTTKDLTSKVRSADVVISGVGEADLIKPDMIKSGAVIIDAGIAESSGKITGDVDKSIYDDPEIKVTPVPGGVGPMTVAALFDNLLIAAS